MIGAWLRTRRRRALLETPAPTHWPDLISDQMAYWALLDEAHRAHLLDLTRILVAEKRWEGCGGLELTEAIQVAVAAQAAVLLLGFEVHEEAYPNVDSVLIYPNTYVVPGGQVDGDGLALNDRVVLGTAHLHGPVVLSWKAARAGGRNHRDGRNVVFHEFAHKLDMLDGAADGAPVLDESAHYATWAAVMQAAWDRLKRRVQRGRRSIIDPYGATDPAEFFAVVTEHFFEQPEQLLKVEPEVYKVLARFYRQDPAERLTP